MPRVCYGRGRRGGGVGAALVGGELVEGELVGLVYGARSNLLRGITHAAPFSCVQHTP